MKNLNKPFALLAFTCAMVAGMTSCGGAKQDSATMKIVKDAMTMDYATLVEKAKEEVGTNTVKTFGNSSQLNAALTKFTEETGIKVENTKKGDAETYTELGQAFANGQYVADMVLLQDANKLKNEMLNLNYVVNYVPKDQSDNLAEDDKNPTAAVYLNKVFMYNNTDYNGSNLETANAGQLKNYFTNVWQVAGSAKDGDRHISNLSFKTPSNENVNMNFLVMLTSEKWCGELTKAYKEYYGKDYVAEDKYPNIGYKWIAEFLTNSKPHSSDGTACKDLAKGTKGSMALVNFNKQKDLKDTGVGKQSLANISFPSIELDADNKKVSGFGGFCYKMYAQVAETAKYPYAACAIVNFLTSKAGFEAGWGTKAGYYSTNKTTTIAKNDKGLAWWKDRLVIEDHNYVSTNYRDVFTFVQQYEGGGAK